MSLYKLFYNINISGLLQEQVFNKLFGDLQVHSWVKGNQQKMELKERRVVLHPKRRQILQKTNLQKPLMMMGHPMK